MAKGGGPSVRGQILGQQLLLARKESGKSMRSAADYLQVDQSRISRMETAIYPARKSEVIALLDFYAVSDEKRRQLMLQLTTDVWRKGWWDSYRKDVDTHFVDYPWLESRADRIMSFEVFALSGLVQTPEYAAVVIARSEPRDLTKRQLDRLVELRMTRQRIVEEGRTRVEMVIDESALRRPVGGRKLMAAQLRHLGELSALANVDIRILPLSTGWHEGFHGQFAVFEMPSPYPDLAYAENLAGQAYAEETNDVDRFRQAYDRLHKAAMSAKRSTACISTMAKEFQ